MNRYSDSSETQDTCQVGAGVLKLAAPVLTSERQKLSPPLHVPLFKVAKDGLFQPFTAAVCLDF